MKYRTMRFIGGEENVSLLGLGCMRFPLKEDGTIDEVQAEAMIERAINAGINYIDTAYPYHKGESEPFLGRALKKYPRNSFYLAAKWHILPRLLRQDRSRDPREWKVF